MVKKIKWVGTLSTTERNNIGLIQVRQKNVNSEVLGFNIVDGNGEPYDLKNRKVLFCTYFDKLAPVEQYAEVIENGKIVYTMNEHDMQKPVRINFAYFKIMDEKDNLVDTTQNFSYDIMPSIESKCMNSEPYIIRLEEVLDAFLQINSDAKKELEQIIIDFNQQIIEQQQNFDIWFESIREILESIDPGGVILNEIVDFRYSKILDKHFNRIKERGDFWDDVTLKSGVDIDWFGAKSDGITDNKVAINKAIEFAKTTGINRVNVFKGEYLVKSHVDDFNGTNLLVNDGGIKILDGITFIVHKEATLKVIENKEKAYNLIYAHDVSNFTIEINGYLIGDKDEHVGEEGEWGYGISLRGASNFKVKNNGEISKFWGDGLNIQHGRDESNNITYCRNGEIVGLEFEDNRRQGTSIEAAYDIKFKKCSFKNTKGVLPQSGVDIEPYHYTIKVDNILFEECIFENNDGFGLLMHGSLDSLGNRNIGTIKTRRCKFTGNKTEGNAVNLLNVDRYISEEDIFEKNGIKSMNSNVEIKESKLLDSRLVSQNSHIIINNSTIFYSKGYAAIYTGGVVGDKSIIEIYYSELKSMESVGNKGLLQQFVKAEGFGSLIMRYNVISGSDIVASVSGDESKVVDISKNTINNTNSKPVVTVGSIELINVNDNEFLGCLIDDSTNIICSFRNSSFNKEVNFNNNKFSVYGPYSKSKFDNLRSLEFSNGTKDAVLNYMGNIGASLYPTFDYSPKSLIFNQNGILLFNKIPTKDTIKNTEVGMMVYVATTGEMYVANQSLTYEKIR